jgi:hypothetical protein
MASFQIVVNHRIQPTISHHLRVSQIDSTSPLAKPKVDREDVLVVLMRVDVGN